MPNVLRCAILLVIALWAGAAAPLPQEAYVWQRLWTPGVVKAVRDGASLFQGWRVLAAETDARGRLHAFPINWGLLGDKPLTAVVRLDGTLRQFDAPTLAAQIRKLAANWPKQAALEIDFDCGTMRLTQYAGFLRELKSARHLSITALPAWLGSGDLEVVLAATDEAVLQVHAVRSPTHGLFDERQAGRWIDAFDRRTIKPFRVALPDYGTRVIRAEGGAVIALESETPRLIGGAAADELLAKPDDVSALIRYLQSNKPRHLAGLVWFRLPVEGDLRVWSLPTLAAVVADRPLTGHISVQTHPGRTAGVVDILLDNDGEIDSLLPAEVALPEHCAAADGINGYRFESQKNALIRLQNALLRAHHARVIGWARCIATRGDFHVRP